jgi:GH25 family lysozyme M1 (1,4-beta-N-acetylmuramidase)
MEEYMKFSKRFLAGLVSAVLLFTSTPASIVSAAKIKYSGTYTKEISIDKVESQNNPAAQIINPAVSDGDAEEPQSEKVRVMPGMKFKIAATRYGSVIKTSKNKSQFKFKTSNKKVAKVTAKGVVTTLKAGKCDITVTNKKDGTKFVLKLTVAKNVKVKSIKLNKTSKKYKSEDPFDETFQLTATVKPSQYADVPVLWGSTNEGVASVSDRGLVTINGFGECKIFCRAGSNNKTAYCKVKVIDPAAPKQTYNGTSTTLSYNTGKLVDISYHNTVTDWKQLKQSCDGVLIRCGYRGYGSGAIVEDSKFRSNVYNCQQYGIPFSVYFFTTATSEEEGREEANWVATAVSGMNLAMPVFVDSEYSNNDHNGRSDGLSKEQRTAAVRGICSQLNARGIPSGVYSSTFWLNNNLDVSQLPYYIWVADYRGFCGYQGSKFAWQYTSNGYGPDFGIANRCDVSEWYQ